METTPDTSGYMIAGYVLTFTVLSIYILSLSLRTKNLKRDAETLESLKTDSKPQAKKSKKK
jgi:hypothetical protein